MLRPRGWGLTLTEAFREVCILRERSAHLGVGWWGVGWWCVVRTRLRGLRAAGGSRVVVDVDGDGGGCGTAPARGRAAVTVAV